MSTGLNKGDTGSLKSEVSGTSTPEDLTDKELASAVEDLSKSNHNLALENMNLERYLVKVDPVAAVGLQKLLDQAAASVAIQSSIQAGTSFLVHGASSPASLKSVSSDTSGSPRSSRMTYSVGKFGTVSHSDKGHRINVNHKMEMDEREFDGTRRDFGKLKSKLQQSCLYIRAQQEKLQELKATEEVLGTRVVYGVDQRTRRIPEERFVHPMEDCLKKTVLMIEKVRLHTSTIKSHCSSLRQQVEQMEELGEIIHPIEFEQRKVENKDSIQRLEKKNIELIEMKKMNGKTALILSNQKKELIEKVNTLEELYRTVEKRKAQMQPLEKESYRVVAELKKSNDNSNAIKNLKSKHTVPKLLDYIRTKASKVHKNVKLWTRRKNVQQMWINTCNAILRRTTAESQKDRTENKTTSGFKLRPIAEKPHYKRFKIQRESLILSESTPTNSKECFGYSK